SNWPSRTRSPIRAAGVLRASAALRRASPTSDAVTPAMQQASTTSPTTSAITRPRRRTGGGSTRVGSVRWTGWVGSYPAPTVVHSRPRALHPEADPHQTLMAHGHRRAWTAASADGVPVLDPALVRARGVDDPDAAVGVDRKLELLAEPHREAV